MASATGRRAGARHDVLKLVALRFPKPGPAPLSNVDLGERFRSQQARILAQLRGDDSDPLARRVSFKTCGGLVVGFVPKSHLLGPPVVTMGYGANVGCPNTGASVFVGRGRLERPMTCPREIPVFLRSDTLEDPVGILKAPPSFR